MRELHNQEDCLNFLACSINKDLFDGFETKIVRESHIDKRKHFWRYFAMIENKKSRENIPLYFGYHKNEQYFFITKRNGEIEKKKDFPSFYDLKKDLIKNIRELREKIEKLSLKIDK